jgi:FkbM family methyltransferase
MRKRILAEAGRVADHQLNRLGVLLCRLGLNVRRSEAVDRHAFRIVLRHLSSYDVSVLKRSLGPTQVDLNCVRSGDMPSPFCWMLWVLALEQSWQGPVLRQVEYVLGDASFRMELDLSRAPECLYYVEDPTPALTCALRVGGEVFYDIGANVGLYALAGSLFFAESHAFEPTPDTLERLARNVALNGGGPVRIHPIALSSTDGQVHLDVSTSHPGSNAVASRHGNSIEVVARGLDSYRLDKGLPYPDFMKIDVERHECDVLAGAIDTIRKSRPNLFVEIENAESFSRFRQELPPSYGAYSFSRTMDPVPVSSDADFENTRDILFVDESRRSRFFDRLKSVVASLRLIDGVSGESLR